MSIFFQGILQDLLTRVETSRIQIPKRTFQVLTRLHHKAKLVSSKSQPYLRASDPDYYRLGFVARHAWLFQREFRNLNTSLSQIKPQDVENGHFDMHTMDQCISELIGDQMSGAKPCNITDECWNFVRSENTTGYMTTHQALYLMVGEIKGFLIPFSGSCHFLTTNNHCSRPLLAVNLSTKLWQN